MSSHFVTVLFTISSEIHKSLLHALPMDRRVRASILAISVAHALLQ